MQKLTQGLKGDYILKLIEKHNLVAGNEGQLC